MAPILHEDATIVVRGIWRDGKYHIYVHPKILEKEMQPRGYWLGSNSLIFEPRS